MLMNFQRVFLLGVISQIMLIEQQGQLLGKVLERTGENRMGVVLHTNLEEPRSLQIHAGSSTGLKDKPALLRKCTFLNHFLYCTCRNTADLAFCPMAAMGFFHQVSTT